MHEIHDEKIYPLSSSQWEIWFDQAWHGCHLDIDRETLEKLPDPEARLELVVERLRETGMGMYADMTPGQLKRILNVYQTHTRAQASYGSRHRISAPILLLRAEESLTGEGGGEERQSRDQGRDWGWSRFTRDKLFIESVPGNHVNMMNAPHVKVLAQKLLVSSEPLIFFRIDHRRGAFRLPNRDCKRRSLNLTRCGLQ
ncbi:MAG: hypothetical protein ABII06_18475 [Pseudomonadota bacterium]